jgi:hypothetical protein
MWPFSRRKQDIACLPKIGQEWAVARADYAGAPLIVRYNQTARNWISHPDLPIKLGFAIPLNNPNEHGLPDPDENSQIDAIEDLICGEVSTKATGIQALVLTTGKMKECIFYINPSADIADMHASIQQQVSTHKVQCMAVKEPGWDTYKEFTKG